MNSCHFNDRENKKLFVYPGWVLWLAWDERDDRGEVYWVDFRILSVSGTDENGPLFTSRGVGSEPFVSDPNEAEIVIHGYIKWDGCCQWWADCAHTDSTQEIKELCAVIEKIYDEAGPILGGIR